MHTAPGLGEGCNCVGMLRFGRTKRKTKAEATQETKNLPEALMDLDADHDHPGLFAGDPTTLAASPTSDVRVPSVSLPDVDPQLRMHQHNDLFATTGLAEEESKGQQPQPPLRDQEPDQGSTAVATDGSTLGTASADQASSLSLSPNPTNGDASSTTEWSSAVGHATTGKSGRVIHTLQEDIARLTREVGVYRSRAEETQRMNDVYKTQVQNMGERLRNLELANETNLQSISRKDQKLKELRADVQGEKERRQNAEGTASHASQLMTQARDDYNRRTAELQEIASLSQTQYDVLLKARQRENAEQQKRFKAIRDDFLRLKAQHETKHVELERLDTIMAQKNREIEAARDSFDQLFDTYEAYKKAHDEEVQALISKGHHGADQLDAALASLQATEGQMKWVMLNHERTKDSGPS